jgi:glycosyltransferase involved in cell wall biosynthesis
VNPIGWDEPFGLVMAEALAAGTPVLAFPRGAAPEIVEDGVTGYLCADVDAMIAAVSRIDRLDRAACRQAAERRFSLQRMARQHATLYRALLAASDRPAVPASARAHHPTLGHHPPRRAVD